MFAQFHPGHEPFPETGPTPIGPFAHLGFDVAARTDIDEIAVIAEAGGWFSHNQGVSALAHEHFTKG